MINDPIIEEIYQVRQQLLAACQGDLKIFLERLQAAEAQHRHRIVSPEDVRRQREDKAMAP